MGITGARSVPRWWRGKRGCSEECRDDRHPGPPDEGVSALRGGDAGRPLPLDQVGIIAERAARDLMSTMELAAVATVSQLRTALKAEPRPDPTPPRTQAIDHQDLR